MVLLASTALGVVSSHSIDGTWTGAWSSEWTDGSNWSSTPSVPDGTATFISTGPTAVQSNGLVVNGSVLLHRAHDYNADRSVSAVFQSLPGASFVVNGARGDPDAALVGGGAEVKWLNGFSVAATFEGEFSGNVTSYAGKGVAKYSW